MFGCHAILNICSKNLTFLLTKLKPKLMPLITLSGFMCVSKNNVTFDFLHSVHFQCIGTIIVRVSFLSWCVWYESNGNEVSSDQTENLWKNLLIFFIPDYVETYYVHYVLHGYRKKNPYILHSNVLYSVPGSKIAKILAVDDKECE